MTTNKTETQTRGYMAHPEEKKLVLLSFLVQIDAKGISSIIHINCYDSFS